MANVKAEVLHALKNGKDMTEEEVIAALRYRGAQSRSFDEEVTRRTAISLALRTLKLEHRVWPTTKSGVQRWNITPKGRGRGRGRDRA